METNDALFVAEADIDQMMSVRNRGEASEGRVRRHQHPTKAGESSRGRDTNNERAPLLSSQESSRRGSVSSGNDSSPPEWFGTAEIQGLPWWKRPSIFWLIPPFLLSTLAYGGIIVPKLNLILDLICRDYYAAQSAGLGPLASGQEPKNCRTDEVSSRVALFLLYGSLCSGILSAITSPKLGALSDRYGRKKILVMTTTGVLVGEILTIFAAKFPETVDVNWILMGYAVDGLCGSFIVGMALAHSYATDCTPPQKRNVAFAYFHACLFTGIAIGPVIAGKIIQKTGSVLLIFYLALGAHLIFIAFLLFCIPESLSKARQEVAREKHRRELELLGPASDWINQLRSINLFRPLKILYPTGPGSSSDLRWNLLLLAATDTIVISVAMGAVGVVVIYLNIEFGWGNTESSYFVSIVNTVRVFGLLVVLPTITRLVRGKDGTSRQKNSGSDRFDLYVIRAAIFFDMLGYLGYAVVRDGKLFILSGAIASFGGIGSPTLGSALTKHVPPDRTGQLLGATGLLHALGRIVGPTVFNGIYSATVGSFRQTVFVVLAALFGVAFVCSWLVKPHVYLEDLEDDGSPRRRSIPDEEDSTLQ